MPYLDEPAKLRGRRLSGAVDLAIDHRMNIGRKLQVSEIETGYDKQQKCQSYQRSSARRRVSTPGEMTTPPCCQSFSLANAKMAFSCLSRSLHIKRRPLRPACLVFADDDVIVDGNTERLCGIDDHLGHVDIGASMVWGRPRDGLWTRISAVAESSSARLTTSRG